MQVITTRQFEKDTEKELNKKLQQQLADIIEQLQKADHLIEIPHPKKNERLYKCIPHQVWRLSYWGSF